MASLKEYIKTLFNSFLNNTDTKNTIVNCVDFNQFHSKASLTLYDSGKGAKLENQTAPISGYVNLYLIVSNSTTQTYFHMTSSSIPQANGIKIYTHPIGDFIQFMTIPVRKGYTYNFTVYAYNGSVTTADIRWYTRVGSKLV